MINYIVFISIFFYLSPLIGICGQIKEIFISPAGNDQNPGTFASPLHSLEKAKLVVRSFRLANPATSVKISLRTGEYLLSTPLQFGFEDGGDSVSSVTYSAYNDENVVISGGRHLKSEWVKVSGNIWKLYIPEVVTNRWKFRQLFGNGKRLQRATSDSLYTVGPSKQYIAKIKKWDFSIARQLKQTDIGALCSFEYFETDLDSFSDTTNAEIIVYHSWEASWHNVYKVDTSNKSIYLTNPSSYPIGFFGKRHPYRIENTKKYFDKAGEWYLDSKNGELWYYAFPNEDPNTVKFIVPKIEKLIFIQGGLSGKNPVTNLNFSGITFQHTTYPWGVNNVTQSIKLNNQAKYPWIDYKKGFSTLQASQESGEAILLKNAKGCNFTKCNFLQLGSYALRIGEYSQYCNISNCLFEDIGAGGIIIGFDNTNPIQSKIPYDTAPRYNSISNSTITNVGIVHPSGVGIAIMQAHHNLINHNLVHNLPYTGISVGWTWGDRKSFTSDNIIRLNHIHSVMKALADGGGVYFLGPQPGTLLTDNYIHDIGRSSNSIGGSNNGLFFDQGSGGINIIDNAIFSIKQQDIRFNQSSETKMKLGKNYFEKRAANKQLLSEVKKRIMN